MPKGLSRHYLHKFICIANRPLQSDTRTNDQHKYSAEGARRLCNAWHCCTFHISSLARNGTSSYKKVMHLKWSFLKHMITFHILPFTISKHNNLKLFFYSFIISLKIVPIYYCMVWPRSRSCTNYWDLFGLTKVISEFITWKDYWVTVQ